MAENVAGPGTGANQPGAGQPVTVVFHPPIVQPGTPEATENGCLCGFESNLRAGFVSAERDDDNVIVVISQDCPRHELVPKPMDDAVGGDQLPR